MKTLNPTRPALKEEKMDEKLKAEGTKTVQGAQWFSQDEILKQLDYENTKDILKKAFEGIKSRVG